MSEWIAISGLVSVAVAVGVMLAVTGYLLGRRSCANPTGHREYDQQSQLNRASQTAHQLESVVVSLRQVLATHHTQVDRFNTQIRQLRDLQDDQALDALCSEADAILGPTEQLASQLTQAYDQIRQQSTALTSFTRQRLDPDTGIGNQQALLDFLAEHLPQVSRQGCNLSLAVAGLDERPPASDTRTSFAPAALLSQVASLLQTSLRESDFVARYGSEFVIVMPGTNLARADRILERLRRKVAGAVPCTLSGGVAEARASDSPRRLLARADAALYSARAAGPDGQAVHTGTKIRSPVIARLADPAAVSSEVV